MKTKILILLSVVILGSFSSYAADTITVSSLAELRTAVLQSNQYIVMTPGSYNFEEGLPSGSRDITCSGSNNTVTLTGVYINVPVGCVSYVYFIISGDNNTFIGGEIEDTYKNGMTEVTDFSAYNQDRDYQAHGLHGDPVVKISGTGNKMTGFTLTTRGSFPFGYGSIYGIGADNVFGLDKRCGILINGNENTLDSIVLHQRAFGHGIFMQSGADGNVIKNTLVEGRVRATAEFYNDSNSYDLPYRTDFKLPQEGNVPIPTDEYNSLSEDGIRMYNNTGSITVENCIVRRMRGGYRLYLGGSAEVTNCTATDCGNTNYNLPSGATVVNSSGNFAYAPLSDFRLSRSRTNVEWTIIPSPHATGAHNLCDILGSNHNITFHRTPGPLDRISRAIVITDDNSTIVNETEYPIILESTASGNNITSCGPVIDNGSGNTITLSDCAPFGASDTIEAEDYVNMSGVNTTSTTDEGLGEKVIDIEGDDWVEYEIVTTDPGTYWIDYRISGDAGEFLVLLNDESVETISFAATADDETWETERSGAPIYLPEGVNRLRVKANAAGWNLNWIQLLPACYDAEFIPYITTTNPFGVVELEEAQVSEVTVFPGSDVLVEPTSVFNGTWVWTGPNGFTSTNSTISLSDMDKSQSGAYAVSITSDCGQVTNDTVIITVQDEQFIEAESYDDMSGVLVYATTDENGGSKVSSISSTDWIEFEVDVEFSALYTIDYRVAAGTSEGVFTASINGDSIDQLAFTSQDWSTLTSGNLIYLKAGPQTLRLTSQSDDWEINWIQLNATETVKSCLLPFVSEGFAVSNESVEWTSGVMDISCGSDLDLHFILNSSGELSTSDYLNIYYSIDGGEKIPLTELTGSIDEMMVSANAISGTTLELFVQSQTASEEASYDVLKMLVLSSSDPFALIEAEDYDDRDGGSEETCTDTNGGTNIGSLSDGNWLMYSNINLTDAQSIDLRLANQSAGAIIEIRIDSITGTLIGSAEVPLTGGWQNWQTVSTYLADVTGFYDVYFVFTNASGSVGNINWLQFSETFVKGPTEPYERFEAEINDGEYGTEVTTTTDIDGEEEVGGLQDDDYIMFSDINIEEAVSVKVRVASGISGVIEVKVGSKVNGDIIGFVDVPNTGDSATWQTVSGLVDYVEGENDIYFVFKGDGDDLFRINWLQFMKGTDAFPRLEAEDYSSASEDVRAPSASTDDADDGEGEVISYMKPDFWLSFADVDLSNVSSVYTRYTTNFSDVSVEVRLDSVGGELLGVIDLSNTGGWSNWATASANLSATSGVHDVYFVYQTENAFACHSNWFQFSNYEVFENIDVLNRIEFEDYSRVDGGLVISATTDVDGVEELGSIADDNWILFKNTDLTDITNINVRYATANDGGRLDVRLGSYNGDLIGFIPLPNTNSEWATLNYSFFGSAEGLQDVYFICQGAEDDLFQLNWFQLHTETSAISESALTTGIELYPNPVSNELTITDAAGSTVVLYNMLGRIISTSSITSDKQTIDFSQLTEGYYLLKATKIDGKTETFKVIKK